MCKGVPGHAGDLLILPAGGLVPRGAPQPGDREARCHAQLQAGRAQTSAVPGSREGSGG